jgi:predicted Kef-type K+ transport protein
LPALPQRPRRRRLAVGWLVLSAVIALLALAILAAIVDRGEIVARWPAAARLYTWVGIPPGVPR